MYIASLAAALTRAQLLAQRKKLLQRIEQMKGRSAEQKSLIRTLTQPDIAPQSSGSGPSIDPMQPGMPVLPAATGAIDPQKVGLIAAALIGGVILLKKSGKRKGKARRR